jgi:hypothetical protein
MRRKKRGFMPVRGSSSVGAGISFIGGGTTSGFFTVGVSVGVFTVSASTALGLAGALND